MDPCSPSHEKNTHPIFVARRCRGREVALRPSEKCKKVRLFARQSAHAAIRPRSGDFFLKWLAFALFSTKLITCFTHRTAVRSSVSRHTQTATHMTPHDLTVSRQAWLLLHGHSVSAAGAILVVQSAHSDAATAAATSADTAATTATLLAKWSLVVAVRVQVVRARGAAAL